MRIESLQYSDFDHLKEFEPPGWGDLIPRFKYCMDKPFCNPQKLIISGKTVAIGTSIMHKDSAWLASIIVHPDFRSNGYGTVFTKKLIDTINRKQYTTIYLDATDLGYPVYKKIGFELETTYSHFKSAEPVKGQRLSEAVIPFRNEFTEQVFKLDQQISCENRQDTLGDHLSVAHVYLEKGRVEGFLMPSLGNGLIIAENDIAGIALMKYRLENNYYAVLPSANKAAIHFLEQTQLVHFRFSRRMYLGKKRVWKGERIYNRISGQLG